ncbi:hypothetical protein B0H13DRAFT_1871195 [Mycena leptocephala]|nr:hypothetical protein B0H13DRAFT_1871195 [Mycena leptocephala]
MPFSRSDKAHAPSWQDLNIWPAAPSFPPAEARVAVMGVRRIHSMTFGVYLAHLPAATVGERQPNAPRSGRGATCGLRRVRQLYEVVSCFKPEHVSVRFQLRRSVGTPAHANPSLLGRSFDCSISRPTASDAGSIIRKGACSRYAPGRIRPHPQLCRLRARVRRGECVVGCWIYASAVASTNPSSLTGTTCTAYLTRTRSPSDLRRSDKHLSLLCNTVVAADLTLAGTAHASSCDVVTPKHQVALEGGGRSCMLLLTHAGMDVDICAVQEWVRRQSEEEDDRGSVGHLSTRTGRRLLHCARRGRFGTEMSVERRCVRRGACTHSTGGRDDGAAGTGASHVQERAPRPAWQARVDVRPRVLRSLSRRAGPRRRTHGTRSGSATMSAPRARWVVEPVVEVLVVVDVQCVVKSSDASTLCIDGALGGAERALLRTQPQARPTPNVNEFGASRRATSYLCLLWLGS